MIEQQPVLSAGPVATPVLRTGLQALTPALILQGLAVFNVWTLTAEQAAWLMAASTAAAALGQNLLERWRNRKLIGRPVPPPEGDPVPATTGGGVTGVDPADLIGKPTSD
jgi:hypothetical protein